MTVGMHVHHLEGAVARSQKADCLTESQCLHLIFSVTMFVLSYLPAWLVKSEGMRQNFGWVIKHVLVPESVLYPVIPSTGLAATDFCDITIYFPLVWSEPLSLVCSLLVQVHCAWRCECQTCLKSIPTPPPLQVHPIRDCDWLWLLGIYGQ